MVSNVYGFQKRDFLLTVRGVNWRQHRRNCCIGKTKTNKMVFSTENLVLSIVLRQEKGYDNASLEITVNVYESVLSRKLMFWTSNWKHEIKYFFTLNFHEFLHTMYKCMPNSVVKISLMSVKYFEYYTIILSGAIFTWTRCGCRSNKVKAVTLCSMKYLI